MVFRPAVYHPIEYTPPSTPSSSRRSCRSCPSLAGAVEPAVPRQTALSVLSASRSTAPRHTRVMVTLLLVGANYDVNNQCYYCRCTVFGAVDRVRFPRLHSGRRGNVLPFAVVFEPFACDVFAASPVFSTEFYAKVFGWGHMISRVVNIIPGMIPLFSWIVGGMGTVLWMGQQKRPKTSGKQDQITSTENATTCGS